MTPTDLLSRSLHSVWHPCTQMKQHEAFPLVPITHGQGIWLMSGTEKRYLDAISSWWVNLFGHCHPHINQRLREQLERLEHVMLAGFTHEPVVRLSEELATLTGHALGHAFYASDGASATEIALKMSFHAWRNRGHADKREFVCVANGYHGETIGALGVTDVALFKDAYVEWPEDLVLDWVVRYWEKARKAGLPVRADFADFYRDYEWMGVQRHIKVLGIFARLCHRDGKDGYLKDMPLVAKYLRAACERYRDLGPFLKLLDELENRQAQVGYTF